MRPTSPYPPQYFLPRYKYHYDLPPSFADGRAPCDCLRTPFSSSLESLAKRATSSVDLPRAATPPYRGRNAMRMRIILGANGDEDYTI